LSLWLGEIEIFFVRVLNPSSILWFYLSYINNRNVFLYRHIRIKCIFRVTLWYVKGDRNLDQVQQIWLLSDEGILNIEGEKIAHVPFQGKSVTAAAKQIDHIAVVVSRCDVWTMKQGKWTKLVSSHIPLNCLAWTHEGKLLVGTAEARLGWVSDGNIDYIATFDRVPERVQWNTPWGGPPDTRSLAVSSNGDLYANIHVGWIVRSQDGGKTWECIQNGLEKDVHQVAAHPEIPAIVFAATARGFHISMDHGKSFVQKPGDMPYLYQRACVCFPDNGVYLVSTSRGPHGQADSLLFRSEDPGDKWKLVEGLPERIHSNIDTYQVVVIDSSKAIAIIENSSIYFSEDIGKSWVKLSSQFPRLYTALTNTHGMHL
jgi:hypothetical protein